MVTAKQGVGRILCLVQRIDQEVLRSEEALYEVTASHTFDSFLHLMKASLSNLAIVLYIKIRLVKCRAGSALEGKVSDVLPVGG